MLKSLNDITPELVKQVEECAGIFFTEMETALALEIDPDFMKHCFQTKQNEIYSAYMHGWLQTEFELRKTILQLAKSGSSPAQTTMLDIHKHAKIRRLK